MYMDKSYEFVYTQKFNILNLNKSWNSIYVIMGPKLVLVYIVSEMIEKGL